MLYSVKMRSAQGGPHEQGGRHISGAERILSEEKIEQAIVAMLHRAQKHQRGMADFISLKVEAVKTADIFIVRCCRFQAVWQIVLWQAGKRLWRNLLKPE